MSDQDKLIDAIKREDGFVIRRLIQEGNVNLNVEGRFNPLLLVIEYTNSYDIIKLLLDS